MQQPDAVSVLLRGRFRSLPHLWLSARVDIHVGRLQTVRMVFDAHPIRVLHHFRLFGATADGTAWPQTCDTIENVQFVGVPHAGHHGAVEFQFGLFELSDASDIQVLQARARIDWQHSDSEEVARTVGFYRGDCDVRWTDRIHIGFVSPDTIMHRKRNKFSILFAVDSQVSPNFNAYGVGMISTALLFDAIIGNVQEKAMREHKASNVEVVQYSYGIGFVYLLVVLTLTGNLMSGLRFCATVSSQIIQIRTWCALIKTKCFCFSPPPLQYPIQTYGYAFLFSLSGYLGIQFVLTLVRTCGAPLAATVTTARKAVTIIISFIFFAKPFSIQ